MADPVFVFSRLYEADIGPHVFPTDKYRKARALLLAGGVPQESFVDPEPGRREWIERIHDPLYLQDLFALRWTSATASSELPLTEEIVRWFETAAYGTITATRLALARGAAMHLGGGFHHAFADRAEGFCYLNDTAVAARLALSGEAGFEPGLSGISVVDLDVHQGNGTARIFRDDPGVFTFSMHQENNYPVKEQSDLDIGLEDGIQDDAYLEELEKGIETAIVSRRPDLVYYLAGADPYREDLLGGLGLSLDAMCERDRRVFDACRVVGARVVVVLAGGYARNPEDTARIHAATGEELLSRWPLGVKDVL